MRASACLRRLGGNSCPKTVTIASQEDYSGTGCAAMAINIYGTLTFNNGKKLLLACGSVIYVQTGGTVTGGGGGGSSNLIDICNNTVWTSGSPPITGPSTVTSGGISSSLPVDLLYFHVNNTAQGTARLTWATATETNSSGFEVQRSLDGINSETIAWVNSQNGGNSLVTLLYEFQDLHPYNGVSYYRLKQIDRNGAYKLYPFEQLIHNNGSTTIYPNPAKDQLLVGGINDEESASLTITNALGMEVLSITLSANNNVVDVSALPAGFYSVALEWATAISTTRLVIQK